MLTASKIIEILRSIINVQLLTATTLLFLFLAYLYYLLYISTGAEESEWPIIVMAESEWRAQVCRSSIFFLITFVC